jgi:glycosyltransferase involved in cell wall biosynthesis
VAAQNIVLIVHYYPPINSSGAKRMEAMSKYFARAGRKVTVIATSKSSRDGEFTEAIPDGVDLIELDWFGRDVPTDRDQVFVPIDAAGRRTTLRKTKDFVMHWLGQLPDPRLPAAISFAYPRLPDRVRKAIESADVVVSTTPPWPPLLSAIIAKWRFGRKIVLDYRDQFSMCHEMPGGAFAKAIEIPVDRFLAKRADALVAISAPMADYYCSFNPETSVILNGYESEVMAAAKARAPWQPRGDGTPLTVRYLGLVSEGRIPRAMLAALSKMLRSGAVKPGSIVFEYYGEVGLQNIYLQEHHPELIGLFKFLPRVSYGKSLELASTADYLLFCENSIPPKPGEDKSAQGILTTKLFEYLASGRPVIAHIGPTTLAGSYIAKASSDHFVSDREEDFARLFATAEFWTPASVAETEFVRSLSRAAQAEQYLSVLDAIVTTGQLEDRQRHHPLADIR